MADALPGEQAGNDVADNAGDGTLVAAGTGSPENGGGPREAVDWATVTALVQALHTPDHEIATVWHPEATGDVVVTDHGNIRASIGPTQYQLTTGEIRLI